MICKNLGTKVAVHDAINITLRGSFYFKQSGILLFFLYIDGKFKKKIM